MYPAELTVGWSEAPPAGSALIRGVYLKDDSQQYNNRPVYQKDLQFYLHYSDYGEWVIGQQLGGARVIAAIQRGLLTPPATGWQYSATGGMKEDPQLTVTESSKLPDVTYRQIYLS